MRAPYSVGPSSRRQYHAKEQDLKCPGCEMHFTRMGTLMQHIERECAVAKDAHHKNRAKKLEFADALARLNDEYARAADKPLGNFAAANPVYFKPGELDFKPLQPHKPDFTPGDLDNAFPPMPSTAKQLDLLADHNSAAGFTQPDDMAWGRGSQLFDAPPPVRPSAEQMASIYAATSDSGRSTALHQKSHHPDEPGFSIHEYYNQYNEKYKCPLCS